VYSLYNINKNNKWRVFGEFFDVRYWWAKYNQPIILEFLGYVNCFIKEIIRTTD